MATITNIKAQNNDIYHYKGDVFDEVWTVTLSTGTAYDLDGKTVVLSIKKDKTDTSDTEALSTTAGTITISGDDNNVITFNKVVSLDERSYYYDVVNTTDNYTLSYGLWVETSDVNR